MAQPLNLSVVIPTREEAGNIAPLVARLDACLAGVDREYVFVDDSDDTTPAVLAATATRNPRVVVLHRRGSDREGGLATAVLAGLRAARGEFACVMDADLQHPPEVIPRLLAACQAGADLAVASRYARGGTRQGLDGIGRLLVSRAAALVARALFSEARATTDPLSGFFVCRRRALAGIELRPVGFKILMELLVCLPHLRVADVPMRFAARTTGESKATAAQGRLYLSHLRSLFFDVRGSARPWKFGLVGLSGLAAFVPAVALLSGLAHLSPAVAVLPPFAFSLLWNGAANRRWTFADQDQGCAFAARYVRRGLASGAVLYAAYLALVALGAASWLASLGGACTAMCLNGVTHHSALRRERKAWIAPAVPVQRRVRRAGDRGPHLPVTAEA
ncbi:MAG: glycosyltransferase [Candidatus Dormibacteria bacterium]